MAEAEAIAFAELYEIQATAKYVVDNNMTRVGLQFPDELLGDSARVAAELRLACSRRHSSSSRPPPKMFVMADSTYGSCCVDEVAAAHVGAEGVIHYGRACLTRTSRVRVRYVYGRAPLDVDHCASCLLAAQRDTSCPLLVLYGLEYAHAMPKLHEVLSGGSWQLLLAHCECPEQEPATAGAAAAEEDAAGGRMLLGGLQWALPASWGGAAYDVVWIGSEGPALTNVALVHNALRVRRYDPDARALTAELANHSRLLQRRYYLVERAKEATIVGILAGTLGAAGYRVAMERVRVMIRASGRKSYLFVMGKPNPAKLANFPECEVFVTVACPQTALLDSKDYLAPIITPFEAQLAFQSGRTWSGQYHVDFGSIMSGQEGEAVPRGVAAAEEEEEEPRFSLITGSYASSAGAAVPRAGGASCGSSRAVIAHDPHSASQLLLNPGSSSREVSVKSSAEYLALRRSYKGLELPLSEMCTAATPVVVQPGRNGRAAGYKNEAE